MADDSDLGAVDGLNRLEVIENRQRIGGEIDGSGFAKRIAPTGAADASVVIAHHRDAMAGQVISDHEKRLVPQQRFVAILLT